MKLDILVFAAHPDDTELSCAGTLIMQEREGHKTGVIDLTGGEMGTRGTPEEREQEAQKAASIMNLSIRENLGFDDSFFTNDRDHQIEIIKKIRQYQPEIVITNAVYDRHPDHGRAASLVEESFFKAGLNKLKTTGIDDHSQTAWRPKKLINMIQSVSLEPDFLIDISASFEAKMNAIKVYQSQFHNPDRKKGESETYISNPNFIKMIESRAIEYGHRIGVAYAEGFTVKQPLGIKNLFDLA